jgi:hypothetical protein
LYPDIAKLTDDEPLDVYGQPKTIPPFNMFVAGTSCKNFSMLRSTRRLDIEDKGCSGETFLAATEVLFKEKPAMALFENVQTAPWLKMQEYITGRVKLSECDSSKAIKEIKDKGKELTFVLDEDGDIVVDRVPAVYGVRCGAVVSGFLRPGSSSLKEVRWPAQIQKKPCTLSDLVKANNISRENDTIVFQTECTFFLRCNRMPPAEQSRFIYRIMLTYFSVYRHVLHSYCQGRHEGIRSPADSSENVHVRMAPR